MARMRTAGTEEIERSQLETGCSSLANGDVLIYSDKAVCNKGAP